MVLRWIIRLIKIIFKYEAYFLNNKNIYSKSPIPNSLNIIVKAEYKKEMLTMAMLHSFTEWIWSSKFSPSKSHSLNLTQDYSPTLKIRLFLVIIWNILGVWKEFWVDLGKFMMYIRGRKFWRSYSFCKRV